MAVGIARHGVERPRHAVEKGRDVRLVVDLQAAFFFDGFPLIVEVRVGDGQRAHPVGFEPQGEVEAIRRHQVPVVGPVFARAAVHGTARALHQLEVLRLLHVGAALEHHVLEQVGEPGSAGPLHPAAHVVPDIDGHDRGRVIFGHDHAEAVGEGEGVVGDTPGLRLERHGRQRATP